EAKKTHRALLYQQYAYVADDLWVIARLVERLPCFCAAQNRGCFVPNLRRFLFFKLHKNN
ncbi:hypothetical protein, partial [Vreelandella aquamarina]|uniref:hypothetical protein n=1 Tax=Vreelandella aquamarina TaxID=77097 RepID=UPI001ABF76D7